MDKDGNIVARPFPKFFNLDEAINQGEQLPLEDFVVQEKFDGSLGILYWVNDKPYLATRGSFISDQSKVGTELLQGYSQYFGELIREYTYLFEIIYPENRIVVDYGGRRDIVLLAAVDTQTGKDVDGVFNAPWGFPIASFVDGIDDYSKLKDRAENNKEGFVIRFKSGKRYKVKFDEYVRLHRLVTGVNARRIWDLLRNHESFDELLERVPDEFFQWVKKTQHDLNSEYEVIEQVICSHLYDEIKDLPTRKEQAIEIMRDEEGRKYSGIIFKMLDGEPYEELIWKLLKPAHEVPFKNEI